jgi:hypothetical protein
VDPSESSGVSTRDGERGVSCPPALEKKSGRVGSSYSNVSVVRRQTRPTQQFQLREPSLGTIGAYSMKLLPPPPPSPSCYSDIAEPAITFVARQTGAAGDRGSQRRIACPCRVEGTTYDIRVAKQCKSDAEVDVRQASSRTAKVQVGWASLFHQTYIRGKREDED